MWGLLSTVGYVSTPMYCAQVRAAARVRLPRRGLVDRADVLARPAAVRRGTVGLAAAPMAYSIHQCDDATVHDATVHDATEWHNATECHKPLWLGDAQRPAHCVLSD